MRFRSCHAIVLLTALITSALAAEAQQRSELTPAGTLKPQVIFVCEHGAAKSIVAAAYFNKLAGERHLDLSAVARGIEPQRSLAASARQGLQKDGLRPAEARPAQLSEAEASRAFRLVSFLDLPPRFHADHVEQWTVPAVGEDYSKSRDAILVRIEQLLDDIQSRH